MSARPSTGFMVWNIVSVNVGWFACVLSAVAGSPWVGPPVVAALVAIHLVLVDARRREVWTLVVVGAFGYAADSLGALAGVFAFPEAAQVGGPSPIWMVALWFNFGVCLNVALYWLAGRYVLAAVFGAIGAPLAYIGGMQLGGMTAPAGIGALAGFVAVEWAIAMPLLLAATAWLGRRSGQPVPAATTT